MSRLNYHHLRLFHAVAREGQLNRAAEHLNISQSALSTQIRTLEASLGQTLFERRGRSLIITEAGRIALAHAESIFSTGEALLQALQEGVTHQSVVRVGGVSTLSRNFQLAFLEPALKDENVEVVLRSGPAEQLFPALETHQLDVVLSTQPPATDALSAFVTHKLSEDSVALVGVPQSIKGIKTLEAAIDQCPLVLPGRASTLRAGWDGLMDSLNLVPRIAAEVDDMAMMRLIARAGVGLALVPPIVVQTELERGLLKQLPVSLPLTETFYAITTKRRFPNPQVSEMLQAYGKTL